MGTTRLKLYCGALRELGERKLASLEEDRLPRHLLDDVYTDVLQQALEEGQWRFAARSVLITPDTDVEPGFGHQNAFPFPDDHVRTMKLGHDEFFYGSLMHYTVEGRYWYTDVDPLYVQYVSNDPAYGMDLTCWPAKFTIYVETLLATHIMAGLTSAKTDRATMEKLLQKRLRSAEAIDAMEDAPAFLPQGTWVSSRGGYSRRDRGSRSRLYG